MELVPSLQPPTSNLHAIIADVRDADRLWTIFEQYRPEIVFHAAAHKHVPLMEGYYIAALITHLPEDVEKEVLDFARFLHERRRRQRRAESTANLAAAAEGASI